MSKLYSSIFLFFRYYNNIDQMDYSPEIIDYTSSFVKTIEKVKKRHDPVVTTIAQGILEYKEYRNSPIIDTEVQKFLDRFYMSRIGIRMLIGKCYMHLKKKGRSYNVFFLNRSTCFIV